MFNGTILKLVSTVMSSLRPTNVFSTSQDRSKTQRLHIGAFFLYTANDWNQINKLGTELPNMSIKR